jgi:hypothetical protein
MRFMERFLPCEGVPVSTSVAVVERCQPAGPVFRNFSRGYEPLDFFGAVVAAGFGGLEGAG